MINKPRTIQLLFITILSFLATSLFSQEFPNNNGTLINDFANIIPDEQESNLRKLVKDYENKTSIQMCVVTVPSLEGASVDDYANSLFRAWGIGQKELNNGLLILISLNDKKWRIEVGYGLEEWITDSYSKSVGEINFKPNFRKGDYYTGINMALGNFMSSLGENGWKQRQELLAIKKQKNDENFYKIIGWITFFAFVLILIIFGIFSHKRKQENERRRLEVEEERKRIQKEIERKRFIKIKESKESITSISEEFSNTKNILENFKSKYTNCEHNKNYVSRLKKASIQIREMLNLTPDVDYVNILNYYNNISNSLTSIQSEINENTSLYRTINSNYENLESCVLDIKMTLKGVEKTLQKLKENYSNIPEEDTLRSKVENLLNDYENQTKNSKNEIDSGNFEKAKTIFLNSENSLSFCTNHIKDAISIESKINSAVSYLKNSKQTLSPSINVLTSLTNNSDVSVTTKHLIKDKINLINSFDFGRYEKNPLFGQKALVELLNDAEQTIAKGKREVSDAENSRKKIEEEKRRKKRQEEEDEENERRRNSYSSSFSSSSYESSSSDSSSSFGGGDSGGGGSSGDW
ncbi:MAG TPA: TPM domain-containing protein [Candidatus Paceibacterota bacterium]|nr:TPM domain-containing protein [Candidatus Paceibacterota bacterium]